MAKDILENIKIPINGQQQTLKTIASISVQDAQRLVVVPYDSSVHLKSIFPCLPVLDCKSYFNSYQLGQYEFDTCA